MNTLEQMKQLIAEMEPNMHQLFVAGKSTYSVKVRNNALALQKLCARMRVEAQSQKLAIKGGRPVPVETAPEPLVIPPVVNPPVVNLPVVNLPTLNPYVEVALPAVGRGRGRGRGTMQ